jgi:hypothetical protein
MLAAVAEATKTKPQKRSRRGRENVAESLKLKLQSPRLSITAESPPPVFVDKRYAPRRKDR